MLHSRQLALQYVNHKSTIVNYYIYRGKSFVAFITIRIIRHLNKESIGGDDLWSVTVSHHDWWGWSVTVSHHDHIPDKMLGLFPDRFLKYYILSDFCNL